MPTAINLRQLDQLLAQGAQLVEALPESEYREGHLPNAVSLPLKELTAQRADGLWKDRPVVVYCWDSLWDLSARAACRLETLGFDEVYDFVAGKVEWLVRQRPIEGERADEPKVGEYARDDVVTCALEDPVAETRERVAESPYPFALVKSPTGVLLGRLRSSRLDCDPALSAADVMEPGPSTVRPHRTASGIARELAERELRWAIVTTPEGELIGVAARAELEAAATAYSVARHGAVDTTADRPA